MYYYARMKKNKRIKLYRKQIPCSDSTAARQTEISDADLLEPLSTAIKKEKFISLAECFTLFLPKFKQLPAEKCNKATIPSLQSLGVLGTYCFCT